MKAKTIRYRVNDVTYPPKLHDMHKRLLKPGWLQRVLVESQRRVLEAQSPGYNPQGPDKRLGPWGR